MNRPNLQPIICLLITVSFAFGQDYTFTQGDWTLKISPSGNIISLINRTGIELVQSNAGDNLIRLGIVPEKRKPAEISLKKLLECNQPVKTSRKPNAAEFEYDLATNIALRVKYQIEFKTVAGFPTLQRSIKIIPTTPPFTNDLLLVVGNNVALPDPSSTIFTPRENGIGRDITNQPRQQWIWPLNGLGRTTPGPLETLAIPFISQGNGKLPLRITHIADPYFTTSFRITHPASQQNGEFSCVYLATKVPIQNHESRTFWTVIQKGGHQKAIDAWYANPLADIPPGPDWLHDIAWQHYDYFSHGGKGWFQDIDALEKLVPIQDRKKIILTIHGWYDMVGRYTFNQKTGKLDDQWQNFPNADKYPVSQSANITKTKMHQRIKYAKQRGFRVCLYFADGLNSCTGAKDIYDPEEMFEWGGWRGPDGVGKNYRLNPAHPRVFNRFRKYLQALLDEYGHEIDALVWDETFSAREHNITTGKVPGYVARAMMRLVRECTLAVSGFRPNLAFLTSDLVGYTRDGKTFSTRFPPYAIMAHGCYQDSHCNPHTWPYGIFPNLRNTLWSCNWAAVKRFDYTKFGVEHYQTPVATSNGWVDNVGIARLTEEQQQAVIKLFNKRKNKRQQLQWLTGPAPVFNKQKHD
ncbi:MAG: alpha-amylase family protein [Planctomycetota bacterium]|jgi:hypothetical protein